MKSGLEFESNIKQKDSYGDCNWGAQYLIERGPGSLQ